MNKSDNQGCLIAGAVLGVLALGAATLISFLFFARKATVERHVHAAQEELQRAATAKLARPAVVDETEMVRLSSEALARHTAAEPGAELTREQFVAMMTDQRATTLARETFAKQADGKLVRWRLRATEVSQPGNDPGRIDVHLELPYQVQTGPSSWSGSSLSLVAELPADEQATALRIRRDDWLTVEGRLHIGGPGRATSRLLGARVVAPDGTE